MLFAPGMAPAGELFSRIFLVSGGIFHKIQCTKVPMGASGSSMTSARLLAAAGTSSKLSSGFAFSPSQVKREGILPPSSNAPVVIFIAGLLFARQWLGLAVPVNSRHKPCQKNQQNKSRGHKRAGRDIVIPVS